MTCDRCFKETKVHTMSKFNRDELCLACKADEKLAPGYRAADAAECSAVRSGDYNFAGVGLSATDQSFLAERLAQR